MNGVYNAYYTIGMKYELDESFNGFHGLSNASNTYLDLALSERLPIPLPTYISVDPRPCRDKVRRIYTSMAVILNRNVLSN
jgi:hypothetical protein